MLTKIRIKKEKEKQLKLKFKIDSELLSKKKLTKLLNLSDIVERKKKLAEHFEKNVFSTPVNDEKIIISNSNAYGELNKKYIGVMGGFSYMLYCMINKFNEEIDDFEIYFTHIMEALKNNNFM